MTTFYRAELTSILEGGRPVHSVALVVDPNGDLAKRVDVEGAQPTADGDVTAKLARLEALEAEHTKLTAILKAYRDSGITT